MNGDSEEDLDDDAAAAAHVISFVAAMASWPSTDAAGLACNPHRPFDLTRNRLIGKVIAFRQAHIGWQVGRIETYASTKGANFTVRFADGDKQRLNLMEGTYAEHADGLEATMAAFAPGSWVILIPNKGASIRK